MRSIGGPHINMLSTGRRSDMGIAGASPKRTTKSGLPPVSPSNLENSVHLAGSSTGWFRNALRMPGAVACKVKRSCARPALNQCSLLSAALANMAFPADDRTCSTHFWFSLAAVRTSGKMTLCKPGWKVRIARAGAEQAITGDQSGGGGVAPHDHPAILNADEIIRRVSPHHIVNDPKVVGGRRISSAVFDESTELPGGMSIDLKRCIEEEDLDATA